MAWLENLIRDARLSVRSLARTPGFTATAVVSLALGIAAGTSVFSLANAVLLRSLPLPDPQQLRLLHWSGSEVRIPSFDGMAAAQDGDRWSGAEAVSHPVFLAMRAQGAPEADIFGFFPLDGAALVTGRATLVADGDMVSDNFFSGLRVRPAVGRLLQPGDDYAGGALTVVLSHEMWRRAFDLDVHVLGRTLALDGVTFTIVGVLPPGFEGVQPGRRADFYIPLASASPLLYAPTTGNWHWYVRLMARLKPEASDARLASAIGAALQHEAGAMLKQATIQIEPGRAGLSYDRDTYRKPLLLMLAVIGLVLTASCANLAGLLLARGTARRHELAVRAALGGGRWRLFEQSLADSLVLALAGGGLGVLLASWGRTLLADVLLARGDGLHYDLSLDSTVLAFSLAVTLAAAVLAGLIPSIQASRTDPIGTLRSHGTVATVRLRTGRVLVAAQICISLIVLTSAGLLVRTVVNLTHADAGFNLKGLLLVGLNIRGGADAHANPAQFYDRLQARVAAIPGVQEASIVEFPLLGSGGHSGTLTGLVGRRASAPATMSVRRLRVGETFFATMGIPIVKGRGLARTDEGDRLKVVVVNESFVRSYVGSEDPLDLSFRMWEAEWRIVGVCRDALYGSIKEAAPPTAYFPVRQMFYSRFRDTHLRTAFVAARTSLPPLSLSAAVRDAVARVDPGVAVTSVTTQERVRDLSIARERLVAGLGAALALVAVLLCWIGLFGLMAYSVARRTGEIGVRVALGATRADVTGPILREALLLAGAGAAVGLPLSLVLTRLLAGSLFGVEPADPVSIGGSVMMLLATAAASAWIPVCRARRVEPAEALRRDA